MSGDVNIKINVKAFGPHQDVERFRKCCNLMLDDELVSEDVNRNYYNIDLNWWHHSYIRIIHNGKFSEYKLDYDGYETQVWDHKGGTIDFEFSTFVDFPYDFFIAATTAFASISFYCEAIYPAEEFCEFGWFNPPEGAHEFRRVDVPEGSCWNPQPLRDAAADPSHLELIAKLARLAKGASQ